MSEAWQRSNDNHAAFLAARQAGLRQLADLIKLQVSASAAPVFSQARPAPILARADLEELSLGSVAKVFGPEFNVYAGRRLPRIPNGDLLLISRVTAILGQRGRFNTPAHIVTEYDVPANAWFFTGSRSSVLPAFVCMEAALQPCGLLSAYLGTMLLNPAEDYYFRNLDGQAEILAQREMAGKTLTARADLLSTTVSAGIILQKFAFTLSCQGQPIYRGDSTFGFFPPDLMAGQSGLDGGKATFPELEGMAGSVEWVEITPTGLPGPAYNQEQTNFIHTLRWIKKGGKYGQGLLYASKEIRPQDWFYRCHFYQDAVMPGSLGVEAVLQALEGYARHSGLLPGGLNTTAIPAAQMPFTWKYRGQLVPANQCLKLEIHINQVVPSPQGYLLGGEASLWADAMRIYEVKGVAIRIIAG